jgi:hypothetical protein
LKTRGPCRPEPDAEAEADADRVEDASTYDGASDGWREEKPGMWRGDVAVNSGSGEWEAEGIVVGETA